LNFDFDFVDALLEVTPQELSALKDELKPTGELKLGALIEYAYLRRQPEHEHLPSLIDLVGPIGAPAAVEQPGDLASTSLHPLAAEVSRMPVLLAENPLWDAFTRRVVGAATFAGFTKGSAYGFVAAFRELADNAAEHSEAPPSVTVAYRWQPREFEVVIADAGIGVRRSLRKNPVHRDLSDDQTALEEAMKLGVSSVSLPGRGTGFNTVLQNIAGFAGTLRFRSGRAALVMDGQRLDVVNQESRESPCYEGLFASIACRT
jgi:hypothetical protein